MYYLTPLEQQQANEFKKYLNENTILYNVAEYLLEGYAIPEYIYELCEDMKKVIITEDLDKDEGETLLGNVFNVDKKTAGGLVKNPKTAGICLRALRDKYEELRFKETRAAAEDRGFIATVLWTIKQAMYWIVKKFGDLKDEVIDVLAGNPENTSRNKRDLLWFKFRQNDFKQDAMI